MTLNVPGEGLVSQPVIIRGVSRDPATMKFTFEAETETGAKHDYAMGATTTPPPTWEPTPPDIAPLTPSPLIWSLENAFSDDGHPGIRIIGACEFPGADSVLIEYRKVGDPDWLTLAKSDAAQAVRQVVAPLDGDTAYEARLAYQSDNRVSEWLVLSSVTTPPAKLAGIDDGATRNVNRGPWAGATAYLAGDIVTHGGASYSATSAHTSSAGTPPPNANFMLLAAAGLNSQLVRLYRRTTTNSAPAVPDNIITYSFTDNSLTGSLDGWSTTEPAVTAGAFLWETNAWATGRDPTVAIAPSAWLATPSLLQKDDYRAVISQTGFGVPCALDGAVEPIYMATLETQLFFQTSAQILVGPANDTAGVSVALVSAGGGAATINTATGTPIAGKPKGFIRITGLATGTGPTTFRFKATKDGIDYEAVPVIVAKSPPEAPTNSYLVRLYKRTTTNTAPVVPDNAITYTFADNTLAGSLDGWSQTEPAVTVGSWLWETFAWASSTDASVVLPPSAWLASPNLLRNDDYTATFSSTGWVVPTAADGSVNPAHLPLQSQLVFRTSAAILLSDIVDTAGVTVASVSTPSGAAATINTATNTPIAGKPKGYIRITALSAGNDIDAFVFKATKDGVDYPATITVTKAYRGEDGAEARGLRLIPNRDRLTRDAWGRLSPATQTFLFTPERENFTAGTVTYEVRNASNLIVGGAPTYGTVVGGNFQMTEAQVIAAAGTTRGVIVFIYDTGGGGKYGAAHIWTDGSLPSGDNEWPDPQLNTGDAYFAGGALAAPFSVQTIGASQGYKYNNYVRVVSTTTPASEFFGKVFEKLPVRHAGEAFYWGYTGGKGVGSGALGAGLYLIFRDIDGVQVGTTQKLFNTTAMSPAGDWPQYNGSPVHAPADAAYVEGGYYRNAHGAIGSSQYQIVNAYLSRSQPNANNTEATVPLLKTPNENQLVNVSYSGSVKAFPTTLRNYRYQGLVDVSESTTWSLINVTSGITATISNVAGSCGVVTITGVTAPGSITVVSSRDNVNVTKKISFVWVYDFIPQDGSPYVSDSPTTVTITSTSWTPVIGPMTILAEHASLTFFQQMFVRINNGTGDLSLRAEIETSPGVWSSIGAFPMTNTLTYNGDEPVVGSMGATTSYNGPTPAGSIVPGNSYRIRFSAALNFFGGNTTSMTILGSQCWVKG
ncbi:MAG: carbohydrate-binding protein [Sphingobium sp.]